MTAPETATVPCPACGASNDVEIWTEVDMATEPEAAQWLIDGFIFEFTCAECGASAKLNHDFVLRHSDKRIIVAYPAKADRAEDVLQSLERMRQRGWTARRVESRDELREKAALVRDGLDDRAVEMAKHVLRTRFVEEGQIAEQARALYGARSDDGIVVEFVGAGEPLETVFPTDIYESLTETLQDEQPVSVDAAWAAQALEQRGWTPDAR